MTEAQAQPWGRGIGSWGLWGRLGGGLRKGRRRGTTGDWKTTRRCGGAMRRGVPSFYVLEADGLMRLLRKKQ